MLLALYGKKMDRVLNLPETHEVIKLIRKVLDSLNEKVSLLLKRTCQEKRI